MTMAGPGLPSPKASLATVDVVFTHTARDSAATTNVPSTASGSSQRERRGLTGPSEPFKKTPRLREARAARVGGNRRALKSALGARPGNVVSLGILSPSAGAGGSETNAAWRRIGLRLSRFVMIAYSSNCQSPYAELMSRKSARPSLRERAHCLLQMQNIHVVRPATAGRRRLMKVADLCYKHVSNRTCAKWALRTGNGSGAILCASGSLGRPLQPDRHPTVRRESAELKPRRQVLISTSAGNRSRPTNSLSPRRLRSCNQARTTWPLPTPMVARRGCVRSR